jgi:hypothetical protein
MKKLLVVILAAGFMAACSSQPSQPTTPQPAQPKAPATITGSAAFFKCYVAARGWAGDAQPYRMESHPAADSKDKDKDRDGKSAEWRVAFASPAQHATKSYTWADGDISPGSVGAYSAANSSTMVFNVQFIKADTDKAFAVAQQHGGDKLLQAGPDTPILYVLDWNRPINKAVWHVIYGANQDTAKLRVEVNASTGEFVKIEK